MIASDLPDVLGRGTTTIWATAAPEALRQGATTMVDERAWAGQTGRLDSAPSAE